MTAELLRRAAKTLLEHADSAAPGPWGAGNGDQVVTDLDQQSPGCMSYRHKIADCDVQEWDNEPTEVTPEDNAEYIALMHPPVARALGGLCGAMASFAEVSRDPLPDGPGTLVAVARAVLREPATTQTAAGFVRRPADGTTATAVSAGRPARHGGSSCAAVPRNPRTGEGGST